MQAVILAAGKGTRLRPLTLKIPKPLVKLAGKPLLEHTFDALPDDITEVILVVGYKAGQIKKYFGSNFRGRKIRYIDQEELKGTFHALQVAKKLLKDNFLIKRGELLGIAEKQKGVKFKFANCGAYALTHAIFQEPVIYNSNGEELLSSMVGTLGARTAVKAVPATRWFPIASVEDLKKTEEKMML